MKRCRSVMLVPACSLLLATLPVAAHEVYGKAGFLGAGIGYSYGFNEYFNVRTDYSTIGTYKRTEKADQLGLYGDWFPMGGAFHFTIAVHQRKLEINAKGVPDALGGIKIWPQAYIGVSYNLQAAIALLALAKRATHYSISKKRVSFW